LGKRRRVVVYWRRKKNPVRKATTSSGYEGEGEKTMKRKFIYYNSTLEGGLAEFFLYLFLQGTTGLHERKEMKDLSFSHQDCCSVFVVSKTKAIDKTRKEEGQN